MSKPHSGQFHSLERAKRQGLILMVPLPAADPVSILQCPLAPSGARSFPSDLRWSKSSTVERS